MEERIRNPQISKLPAELIFLFRRHGCSFLFRQWHASISDAERFRADDLMYVRQRPTVIVAVSGARHALLPRPLSGPAWRILAA